MSDRDFSWALVMATHFPSREPRPAKVLLGERFEAVFGPDSNHPIERNEKTFEGYDFEPFEPAGVPSAQKNQVSGL